MMTINFDALSILDRRFFTRLLLIVWINDIYDVESFTKFRSTLLFYIELFFVFRCDTHSLWPN